MRRILIVEDDPDLREVLAYELVREGFGVDETASGKEALRLCQRRPPDLVLLDLMLPDYSGTEICQALRRSRETERVPVIFLTACGAEDDRIRGLEVGADDYLSKPFNMRELILRIHALLKRAEAAAHAPISPVRVAHREQLRVWQGFAANHMGRAEWREAREIWRAIRARFESDLSTAELAEVETKISDCDQALTVRHLQ
jgi:two-component system phosphate regulon response regulator PhoB